MSGDDNRLRETCPACLRGARGRPGERVTCARCGRRWTLGERNDSAPAIIDLGRNTGLFGRRKSFGAP